VAQPLQCLLAEQQLYWSLPAPQPWHGQLLVLRQLRPGALLLLCHGMAAPPAPLALGGLATPVQVRHQLLLQLLLLLLPLAALVLLQQQGLMALLLLSLHAHAPTGLICQP
jgi:hypothetical protein